MPCPKCGTTMPVRVTIEETYVGDYDDLTSEVTIDYGCVTREITVTCENCDEELPNSIANPRIRE